MNNFFSSGRYNKRLLQACEYDKKRKEFLDKKEKIDVGQDKNNSEK